MARFVKEFVVYGLSGALSKLVMVFLVPVYTRVLTTDDYGILGFAATMAAALNILCDFQMTSAMGRFFYEEESLEGRRVLVGTGLISVLSMAVFAGLALTVSASPLAAGSSKIGLTRRCCGSCQCRFPSRFATLTCSMSSDSRGSRGSTFGVH